MDNANSTSTIRVDYDVRYELAADLGISLVVHGWPARFAVSLTIMAAPHRGSGWCR